MTSLGRMRSTLGRPIRSSRFLRRNANMHSSANMLRSAGQAFFFPFFPRFLHLRIRREFIGGSLYCFCTVRRFFFLPPSVCTPGRNCESLSWVMCVYPPPGAPEVTPNTPPPAEASASLAHVWRFPQKWPGLFFWRRATPTGAAFQQSGPALAELRGEVGWGGLLAGPCNVFRSTDFWQRRSI